MTQTGWAIQITRCAYLDDPEENATEHYAVNLAMPWSADGTADSLVDGKGPQTPVAAPVRKELLPWHWTGTNWHVFARSGAAAWTFVGNVGPLKPGTGFALPNATTDLIGEEILDKTADCTFKFSLRPEEMDPKDEKKRSLPHALAPLTHWPAVVSNNSLAMAGFLALDTAELDKLGGTPEELEIVCFPEFQVAGDKPGLRTPDKTPQDHMGAGCVIASYAIDTELRMACRAVKRIIPAWQQPWLQAQAVRPKPSAEQGDRSVATVRSLAARQLAPLAILMRAVARLVTTTASQGDPESATPESSFVRRFSTEPDLRDEWNQALWEFIGSGQEPSYSGAGGRRREPHVLHRLVPPEQAEALLGLLQNPSHKRLEAALQTLAKRLPTDTWSVADQYFWGGVATSYNELHDTSSAEADTAKGLRFLRTWLEVAHALHELERARQFMAPWLVARIDGPWQSPQPDPLSPAQLEKLRITGVAVDASVLGLIQKSQVSLWDSLADPKSMTADGIEALLMKASSPLKPLLTALPDAATAVGEIASSFVRALQSSASPATPRPRDPGLRLHFESADPGAGFDQSVRGYALALCAFVRRADNAWLADRTRARWITDTAVSIWERKATPPLASWLRGGNGELVWTHETVGSTLQDGIRTTEIEYQGRPVCAMLANAEGKLLDKDLGNGDADGSDTIDFLWHADAGVAGGRELPLLGYGLHYRAVSTCIDNAGGVVNRQFRESADLCAQLKEATNVFAATTMEPQWQYRSAVPPGAPAVIRTSLNDAAFELSEDTKAHAHQIHSDAPEQSDAPVAKVALIAHDQKVEGKDLFSSVAPREHTLRLEPPASSAEFVERWLNTDIILRERQQEDPGVNLRGSLSDPNFESSRLTTAALTDFRNQRLEAIELKEAKSSYHPAVAALGVAVWEDGKKEAIKALVCPIERTEIDSTNTLQLGTRRHVELTIKAAAIGGKTDVNTADDNHSISIRVACGRFIRVRAFSLVYDGHFADAGASTSGSADHRFFSGIELASNATRWVPEFKENSSGKLFRAFGPQEWWFEAAPEWERANDHQDEFKLTVVAPGEKMTGDPLPLSPDLFALSCECKRSARWVRSLFVQRHEWHWTGYPVRLPRDNELHSWLASFAGVESYREAKEIDLVTGFDSANRWGYGSDASGKLVLLTRTLQAGTRPARYAAFTARPVVRFRKWLSTDTGMDKAKRANGPIAFESDVYGAGALIKGVSPANRNERLPIPPLRWSVPLTSTYASADDRCAVRNGAASVPPTSDVVHVACGNLLVCDDALRRTDQLSLLGGIGDTVEIDLLETRMQEYREIGVNPIFHANLDRSEIDELDLCVHEPFGLTHDNSANALVSQTGIVVSTHAAKGKWLLAKIQARRLTLPETLVNSALPLRNLNTPTEDAHMFDLPLRSEGEDSIPLDFALDFKGQQPSTGQPRLSSMTILLDPGTSNSAALPMAWPKLTEVDWKKELRLLCSWHRRRWGEANNEAADTQAGDAKKLATWRLQVLAQQRDSKTLSWQTLSKLSCFQNTHCELPSERRFTTACLRPEVPGDYAASLVRMSDYTDPIWLTFIGSFGLEQSGDPNDYWLTGDGNSLELHARSTLPTLSPLESVAPCFQILLVYRPLADVMRGDPRFDTGRLIGVYHSSNPGPKKAPSSGYFKPMNIHGGKCYEDNKLDMTGCLAYLCSVQRITATSTDEAAKVKKLCSFEDLIEQLFPEAVGDASRESTMRLLPEFIGPIPWGKPRPAKQVNGAVPSFIKQ
ncbi:MAG: hypothetical protein IAE88_14485 [Rhodobacteraceae bacterium]|nr:hypothetical protein [Paracoccaceae bacterium]